MLFSMTSLKESIILEMLELCAVFNSIGFRREL